MICSSYFPSPIRIAGKDTPEPIFSPMVDYWPSISLVSNLAIAIFQPKMLNYTVKPTDRKINSFFPFFYLINDVVYFGLGEPRFPTLHIGKHSLV